MTKSIHCMVLVLILLLTALQSSVFAWEERQVENSLRCNGRIIFLGDSKYKVLSNCGEPTWASVHEEERIARDTYKPFLLEGNRWRQYRTPLYVTEQVIVEEWTYNFGSTRFIRYLRFENDRLVSIEAGDYGD